MSQESSSGSGVQETPSPSLLNNLRQFRFQKKSSLTLDVNCANGIVSNGASSKYDMEFDIRAYWHNSIQIIEVKFD